MDNIQLAIKIATGLITAIATGISASIALRYRPIPRLQIKVIEIGSSLAQYSGFYRYYTDVTTKSIVGTMLQFNIKIRNKGYKSTVIEPIYKISIKSPEYDKILSPTKESKPYVNIGKNQAYYRVDSVNHANIPVTIDEYSNDININCDSKWNYIILRFSIDGLIIPESTRELYCTFELHDYDNRKAKCKVRLIRQGI